MLIPGDVARAVRRTTTTFVLNWIDARQRALDLDPLEFLIFHTIAAANLQHLPLSRRAALDDPEVDAERRPVSIEGVAAALNVPGETVRRRLRALAERRLIDRMGQIEDEDGERSGVSAGLAVDLPALETPPLRRALDLELSQLWRLLLSLEALGVIRINRDHIARAA
ncbi:Lrp/AsnC family transcriptional regulator [uncultured Caulobacter sp.]|uniref:Lrp/AsnC family transcriptional regulator n=1 Tax=uncultured Caulobacter sp. TaxID=158749 RepID=UPI00260C72D1|nr:Lrp/AsnC family transcriptional regulator [uncultured Caulobacter sp.]